MLSRRLVAEESQVQQTTSDCRRLRTGLFILTPASELPCDSDETSTVHVLSRQPQAEQLRSMVRKNSSDIDWIVSHATLCHSFTPSTLSFSRLLVSLLFFFWFFCKYESNVSSSARSAKRSLCKIFLLFFFLCWIRTSFSLEIQNFFASRPISETSTHSIFLPWANDCRCYSRVPTKLLVWDSLEVIFASLKSKFCSIFFFDWYILVTYTPAYFCV